MQGRSVRRVTLAMALLSGAMAGAALVLAVSEAAGGHDPTVAFVVALAAGAACAGALFAQEARRRSRAGER